MVKTMIIMLTLTILSGQAFAGLNCRGNHKGSSVELKGQGSLTSPSGTVFVDGREVSQFDKLKVSIVFRTFKGKNNQGDVIDGKVTDLGEKTGYIHKLSVPGYGIKMSNIPVNCN